MELIADIWTPKLIIPDSPLIPTKVGLEWAWDEFGALERRLTDRLVRGGRSIKDAILEMAGSDAFYLSKKFGDLVFGATAYTAPATLHLGLWTSALLDSSNGATAGETTYGSYARLQLTNNTTIFATGSGTTTYVKTWPSDATKSWATSTGAPADSITYLGVLDAGGASNLLAWASVTSVTINTGDTPQLAQNAFSQTRD